MFDEFLLLDWRLGKQQLNASSQSEKCYLQRCVGSVSLKMGAPLLKCIFWGCAESVSTWSGTRKSVTYSNSLGATQIRNVFEYIKATMRCLSISINAIPSFTSNLLTNSYHSITKGLLKLKFGPTVTLKATSEGDL